MSGSPLCVSQVCTLGQVKVSSCWALSLADVVVMNGCTQIRCAFVAVQPLGSRWQEGAIRKLPPWYF